MTLIDFRTDITEPLPPAPTTGDRQARTDPNGVNPLAEDWWTGALCRTTPRAGDLFFSEDLAEIGAAKRICADCPAIAPCLEGAISRAEPCGVWGGQLFEKGRVVLVKRRRGRPPKHPRPEDQIPLVPVPEHLQRLIA